MLSGVLGMEKMKELQIFPTQDRGMGGMQEVLGGKRRFKVEREQAQGMQSHVPHVRWRPRLAARAALEKELAGIKIQFIKLFPLCVI